MARKRLSSQSCAHSSVGLQDHFAKPNRIVKTSHNSQRVHEPRETNISSGMCASNVRKESYNSSETVHNSGNLQQVVFSSKTWEKMATGYRSQCVKQTSNCTNFQNGNGRSDKELHLQRGIGGVHRSHRRVLPHSYSSKVTISSAFSCGRSFVPIQSPTFWYSNGSTRILRSQRSKANAAKQRNLDTPVPRRLVTSGSIPADLHGSVKTTGGVCPGTRLSNQLQENRVNTNSKIQLSRVQVRLKQRRSLTHTKEMAHFDNSHRRSKHQFDNNSENPDVVYRHSGISKEDNPNGQVAHEALPVVPENPLEVSPIIGQKDLMFRDFEKASDLVEKSKTCIDRLSPPCRGTQSPVIHRCIC